MWIPAFHAEPGGLNSGGVIKEPILKELSEWFWSTRFVNSCFRLFSGFQDFHWLWLLRKFLFFLWLIDLEELERRCRLRNLKLIIEHCKIQWIYVGQTDVLSKDLCNTHIFGTYLTRRCCCTGRWGQEGCAYPGSLGSAEGASQHRDLCSDFWLRFLSKVEGWACTWDKDSEPRKVYCVL